MREKVDAEIHELKYGASLTCSRCGDFLRSKQKTDLLFVLTVNTKNFGMRSLVMRSRKR